MVPDFSWRTLWPSVTIKATSIFLLWAANFSAFSARVNGQSWEGKSVGLGKSRQPCAHVGNTNIFAAQLKGKNRLDVCRLSFGRGEIYRKASIGFRRRICLLPTDSFLVSFVYLTRWRHDEPMESLILRTRRFLLFSTISRFFRYSNSSR